MDNSHSVILFKVNQPKETPSNTKISLPETLVVFVPYRCAKKDITNNIIDTGFFNCVERYPKGTSLEKHAQIFFQSNKDCATLATEYSSRYGGSRMINDMDYVFTSGHSRDELDFHKLAILREFGGTPIIAPPSIPQTYPASSFHGKFTTLNVD